MSGLLGVRAPVRVAAAAVSVGVIAGFLTVGAVSAAEAVPASVRPAAVTDAKSAADVAGAQAIAAKFDHSVTVASMESPTRLVSANPDGSMHLEADAVPVRAKVDGSWKPVDFTLVSSDGYLAPAVTAQPVQFSLGGDGPMARVQDGTGTWIAEHAPFGALPKPTLKGSTATYADVLPGTDLKLTATATGMSEVLVVNTPAAAANPKLTAVKFDITGGKVSTDENGTAHVGAVGGDGLIAAPSIWWDSSQGSTAAGPSGTVMPQPVDQTTTQTGVTIDASAAARAPGVTYPVFVDPPWSAGQWAFWYIDQAYPSQSYLNGQYASGVQRVGWVDAAHSPQDHRNHKARAYWVFDTSGLAGKQILAAQFSASLNGAYNCGIMHSSYLAASGAPVGGTWNSESGYGASVIDTQTPGGCGAVVGFNAAGAGYGGTTELEILSTDEGNNTGWQKWNQGATLSVTYNSQPNQPNNLTFSSPSRACSTNASQPTYIDGTQPISLTATSTDPDAGNIATTFGVHGVTNTSYLWPYYGPSQAQGPVTAVVPANTLAAGEYYWMTQSTDGYWNSPLSIACYFQVQLNPPGLPTVTKTSSGTPQVGKPMTVDIHSTTADNVQLFAVWWVDGAQSSASTPPVTTPITPGGALPACNSYDQGVHYICPDPGSTNATGVTVAPIDQTSTLMVASYDHSGRISVGSGSAATALTVTATADSNVGYAHGHLWDSAGYPTSATSISDQGTSSTTTGSTVPQPLTGAHLTSGTFMGDPTTVLQLSSSSSSPSVQVAHTVTTPVDPTSSYTVSLWIDATSGTTGHIFSGAGKFSDAPGGPGWGTLFDVNDTSSGVQFCVNRTYSANVCTAAHALPAGSWVLVTGVWDSVNKQARLLINEVPAPVATSSTPAAGTATDGGLVAAGLVTTTSTGSYAGSISAASAQIYRPAVFPGVISRQQLHNLANPAFGGPNGENQSAVPLAVDAQVSADTEGGWGSTVTTAPISTSGSNELLVAMVSADGPQYGQTLTVSGGGLTWTRAVQSNQTGGDAEVWTAPAPTALSGITVTSTESSGSEPQSLTVLAVTGASGVGAVSSASLSGAARVSLTSTAAGSMVLAAGSDVFSSDTRTPGTGQTVIHDDPQLGVGDDFWAQRTTGTTTAAGQTVTISDSADGSWNLAEAEILPAVSAPVAIETKVSAVDQVGTGTVTTPGLTTAQAGDVLVATVSADATGAFNQSATVTGGGLTWRLVERQNSVQGDAEVWTATADTALVGATFTSALVTPLSQSLTVVAFKNAAGVGASATAGGVSGEPTVSLTTTRVGSMVIAAGDDWDSATHRTVPPGQTMLREDGVSSGDDFWTQSITATTATAGSTATVYDTAPTNEKWNLAAVEVIPALSGAVGIDTAVSADAVPAPLATAPITTTGNADTLLAFVAVDGWAGGGTVTSVTSDHLTWSLVENETGQPGDVEIWQATADGPLSNEVVTASMTNDGGPHSLTVVAFAGAAGVGAASHISGFSSAPGVSLATTVAGSMVFAVGNDKDDATPRTLGTNQSLIHEDSDTGWGEDYWVQRVNGTIATAGTAVTVNDTAPNDHDQWNLAAVEIIPAS